MTDEWVVTTGLHEERRVKAVHNIVGTPAEVAIEVNYRLTKGWDLGSELMSWTEPRSKTELFVQQVIQYEEEDDDGATVRREN